MPGASGGGVFEAAGGAVLLGYAPGVDDVPVIASRGESILVPELTRGIGPANIMALNHQYSGGRPEGAGPARSALSTVLGLATTQTQTSGAMTSTLSSADPATGGADLAGCAPAPSKGGALSFTFAPRFEVSGGGANGQAIADDLEGRRRELFEEFVDGLERDLESAY